MFPLTARQTLLALLDDFGANHFNPSCERASPSSAAERTLAVMGLGIDDRRHSFSRRKEGRVLHKRFGWKLGDRTRSGVQNSFLVTTVFWMLVWCVSFVLEVDVAYHVFQPPSKSSGRLLGSASSGRT